MFTTIFSRNPVMAGTLRGRMARTVMSLLVLLMLGTAVMPGVAAAREVDVDDGRTELIEPDGEELFRLKLPNGGELSFVPLIVRDERVLGYGVAEMLPPDATSYLAIRELRGADPAEVVNAFLPDDARFPRELIAKYGRPELGPRGWAIDHEVFTDIGLKISPCYEKTFGDDFPNHAQQNYVYSFYDGVFTKPSLWSYDSVGPEYLGYHTRREADNVPSIFAKVTRCKVADLQYTPAGPMVRLEAGLGGETYFQVPMGSLPKYGSTVSFNWFIPSQYNVIMDWDLVVHSAWPGDEFHIGYGWSNFSIK